MIKAQVEYWFEAITTPELLYLLADLVLHNPSSFIMLILNFSEEGTLECRILTISRAQAKQIQNRKTSIKDFKDFFTIKMFQ